MDRKEKIYYSKTLLCLLGVHQILHVSVLKLINRFIETKQKIQVIEGILVKNQARM